MAELARRRDFLALGGIAACGAARAQGRLPEIGILLATTYTTGSLEERLSEAEAHGLSCVHRFPLGQ